MANCSTGAHTAGSMMAPSLVVSQASRSALQMRALVLGIALDGYGPAQRPPPILGHSFDQQGLRAGIEEALGDWRGTRRGGAIATPWSTWRIRSDRRAGCEPTRRHCEISRSRTAAAPSRGAVDDVAGMSKAGNKNPCVLHGLAQRMRSDPFSQTIADPVLSGARGASGWAARQATSTRPIHAMSGLGCSRRPKNRGPRRIHNPRPGRGSPAGD